MTAERDLLEHELELLNKRRADASIRTGPTFDGISRAAAQRELDQLDTQIREIARRLRQIDDKAREDSEATTAALEADARRSEREEAAFWFRRFFTTLGIANAAAFAALASGLLQADKPADLAAAVAPAMDRFIIGALAAGSIPFWLWAGLVVAGWIRDNPGDELAHRLRTLAHFLARQAVFIAAIFSVYFFCWGLFIAAGAAHGLAEGKKVADARAEAQSKLPLRASITSK